MACSMTVNTAQNACKARGVLNMYRRNYGVKLKNKYRKTLGTYIAIKVSIVF